MATSIAGYPETLNLRVVVHTREVGRRPYIELEPSEHVLSIEQRRGITIEQVREITSRHLHG
jgi:hypothetical protein